MYANGNKYDGEWKDGNFNGTGTIFYVTGTKFTAEWRNGKPVQKTHPVKVEA